MSLLVRVPILKPLELTAEERELLESWTRQPKTGQALARRARIVLACSDFFRRPASWFRLRWRILALKSA